MTAEAADRRVDHLGAQAFETLERGDLLEPVGKAPRAEGEVRRTTPRPPDAATELSGGPGAVQFEADLAYRLGSVVWVRASAFAEHSDRDDPTLLLEQLSPELTWRFGATLGLSVVL